MAKKIQIFVLESGKEVGVEVLALSGEEERISASREEVVEHTGKKFSDALEGVREAAKDILDEFAKELKPDQLEMEFGLKFSAKAGVVLASTDAEATLSLKATWKRSIAAKEAASER